MKKEQLGEILKKARGKIPKRQICQNSTLTSGQIKQIEEGDSAYTVDTLLSYCELLGVNLEIERNGQASCDSMIVICNHGADMTKIKAILSEMVDASENPDEKEIINSIINKLDDSIRPSEDPPTIAPI